MQHILYLFLRQLRAPITTIIVVYAIAILGFVLIPGQDDAGNVWRMDFFHAFYFVSYMGSTIGFGEIPYAFTGGQRAWATVTLYATVVSWLYSIGKIFALFQDRNLQRLLKRAAFARRVKRMSSSYYLVCGYGVTGSRLIHLLDERDINTVMIEVDQDMFDQFAADGLAMTTPGICADASDPDILSMAGIKNPLCVGVLAVTNDDHANLAVAINAKLVDPDRLVISNTQSKETTGNLASFGTDYIIDPFEIFADHLYLVLKRPYRHLLHNLIVNPHHKVWASPYQNTEGRWVVCGYGRFGKALEKKLSEHDIEITFIDPDPQVSNAPEGTVVGLGTEANTLRQAGIEDAVGIIAGTGDDPDNLSIIITARELNPDLITVARQNRAENKPMFRAANVNMIMEPGRGVANEAFMLVRMPMLAEFFNRFREWGMEPSKALFLRITEAIEEEPFDSWTLDITAAASPAIYDWLSGGDRLNIDALIRDPRDREYGLAAVPLMIKRDGELLMAPEPDTALEVNDQILFCGQMKARRQMLWAVYNHTSLRYVMTGNDAPDGLLWRWWAQRKQRKAASLLDRDVRGQSLDSDTSKS